MRAAAVVVTASQLARNTSALLDEVGQGRTVIIQRRGQPVACLVPHPVNAGPVPRGVAEGGVGHAVGDGAAVQQQVEGGVRHRGEPATRRPADGTITIPDLG